MGYLGDLSICSNVIKVDVKSVASKSLNWIYLAYDTE